MGRPANVDPPDIPDIAKSVILGSMLGDGGVYLHARINNKNARYQELKCLAQESYLRWKALALSCFSPVVSIWKSDHGVLGPNTKPEIQLYTKCAPYFTALRAKWYCHREESLAGRVRYDKTIPFDDLEYFDETALAVWYLDDGWFRPLYGDACIATDCFGRDAVVRLSSFVSRTFGIESTLLRAFGRKTGHEYWQLRLARRSFDSMRELILPVVRQNPCMAYKIGEVAQTSELLSIAQKASDSGIVSSAQFIRDFGFRPSKGAGILCRLEFAHLVRRRLTRIAGYGNMLSWSVPEVPPCPSL